jgi:mRNA-degrading endonuclease toxin of MazEF toxin-antitoxin module
MRRSNSSARGDRGAAHDDRAGLSNEVELDEADGVLRACVTSFDNRSTIARGQLVEKIATLDPVRMDEICRALHATVAC